MCNGKSTAANSPVFFTECTSPPPSPPSESQNATACGKAVVGPKWLSKSRFSSFKKLKTSKVQIILFFRFLRKTFKKFRFQTHSHSRRSLPFSLISYVYRPSYYINQSINLYSPMQFHKHGA